MKYISDFRKAENIIALNESIFKLAEFLPTVKLMEVCGTHTMAAYKYGIRSMLPGNIKILSGPGCPVCVTPNSEIDKVLALAEDEHNIITTFGDMLRVPGSYTSLMKKRACGADIRVVYSAIDALKIAEANKNKNTIFIGVGFETTAPTIAASIIQAKKSDLSNFYVLGFNKVVPPALEALVADNEINVNGFICPGHVSTIIGSKPYEFLANKHNIPCVVTGFEPVDILQGILMLLSQIKENDPKVEIQYKRSVKYEGNLKAQKVLYDVYEQDDSEWRGIGNIPGSGLKIKMEYNAFDVECNYNIKTLPPKEHKGCICGQILKGVKSPQDCQLFAKQCTPEDPKGACMVSSEGTCAAAYKYTF